MSIASYEGQIENGQIRLKTPVKLPEHAQVVVVVIAPDSEHPHWMPSPRLVNRKDAARFKMEVTKD